MKTIFLIIVFAVLYVGFMNWGEKWMFFNGIRKPILILRKYFAQRRIDKRFDKAIKKFPRQKLF